MDTMVDLFLQQQDENLQKQDDSEEPAEVDPLRLLQDFRVRSRAASAVEVGGATSARESADCCSSPGDRPSTPSTRPPSPTSSPLSRCTTPVAASLVGSSVGEDVW